MIKSKIIGEYNGVQVELHSVNATVAGEGYMFSLLYHNGTTLSYRDTSELNKTDTTVDDDVYIAMINNYIKYYA